MTLAPIILFVYNRPDHTRQTLEALAANRYAEESRLYIYCDGAKEGASAAQLAQIAQVRQVIRSRAWCKEVVIVEQEKNRGLANSVIAGVSEVLANHERVIVLEDDIVTSPLFLSYMNQSLAYYEQEERVFSVGGYNPIPRAKMPQDYPYDLFVTSRFLCWGWGTWRDRWQKGIWTMDYISQLKQDWPQIKAFNRGGNDLFLMLLRQYEGKIDSWAVRFAYTTFHYGGVAIAPCHSYIRNIGTDGSGVHFNGKGRHNVVVEEELSTRDTLRFTDSLEEEKRLVKGVYATYATLKNRVKLWLKRWG